jgi:ribonuclease D
MKLLYLVSVVQVIALDLEAHHVHSFNELVCLIQVAAGGACYIIDALVLHDDLHLLRGPLEDCSVLKLVHGGRSDVQWLQGLGIFLCNVLDTCELALVQFLPENVFFTTGCALHQQLCKKCL